MPSRKNPTTIMQTNTVKMPDFLIIERILESFLLDTGEGFACFLASAPSSSTLLGRMILIAIAKTAIDTKASADATINTLSQLINVRQSGTNA